MKNLFNFFFLLVGVLLISSNSQTACDYELQIVSSDMNYFNTRAFNPLQPEVIYDRLNSLRASILATYQLCFNKMIINPDDLYPQDISSCLSGLYNVSLLANIYTGNSSKIRADIDSIAKVVFSTQNNCRPVLYYKGWSNITDDCKNNIPSLDDLFNQYGQELELGKNGLQYINNMILLTERLRKLCGFSILIKASSWAKDTCQAANNNWLYPLTDQMDTFVIENKYTNFTATFYNLYQSLYRVKNVCNVSLTEDNMIEDQFIGSENNLIEREGFLTIDQ